jgi:hypothetical protein
MRKQLLFVSFLCFMGTLRAQDISVDDFLEFASYSPKKVENLISKKGFTPAGKTFLNDTIVDTWQQMPKKVDSTRPAIERRISKFQNGTEIYYSLQTTSKDEYQKAVYQLKKEGFVGGVDTAVINTNLLLQRRNISIQGSTYAEDDLSFYSLFFEHKPLPSARSIQFANDLLQFTSHEYLTAFFGSNNVKKDLYYFSEKEVNKCSVLFPNTPRQAVFIWKDELNLTSLSHIIIGGSIRTAGSVDFTQQITENSWRFQSGIRVNMRLEELLDLNTKDVSFYGRNSEYFLTVAPQTGGEVDLTNTCVMLDCINCEGDGLLDQKLIKASDAVDRSLRLHVGMIILMPPVPGSASKYAAR